MKEPSNQATKDPPPAVNGNGVKPQLHQTHLESLSKCGEQFKFAYAHIFGAYHKRIIAPPNIALVTGIAVHKAVEANLRHKIENEILLPIEQVREAARDAVHAEWEGGVMLSVDEQAIGVKKVLGNTTDQAVALAALHATEVAPMLEPLAAEENFVIEMPGYPIDLAGTIDVRELNALRDTKTASQKPADNAAQCMQLAMYALSHKLQTGALPAQVYIDALVKTKTPKAVTVSAVPEDFWMVPLLNRIERFIEIIEAVKEGKRALFTPAATDGPNRWVCTKKWCGYWDRCKFFSGREK